MAWRQPPLLDQRLVRRRYSQESLLSSAGVRMRTFGKQFVGAMNFALGQPAAERQPQELAGALFRRQRFGQRGAPAELPRGERRQYLANDVEPSTGRDTGEEVSAYINNKTQKQQNQRNHQTQHNNNNKTHDLLR